MKVRVLKTFRDKNTKEVYQPGTELDLTKKRFTEIEKKLGAGFVEEITEGEAGNGDS